MYNVLGMGGMNRHRKTNEFACTYVHMAGPGIEPGTPASLVRCSSYELSCCPGQY